MPRGVKNIAVLGSTGTIGINTLRIVERYPGRFKVVGLTAFNNVALLEKQIRKFKPAFVAVGERNVGDLRRRLRSARTRVLSANAELAQIAAHPKVDIVLIGMTGSVALEPFLSAVRAGKRVAPANKEALVIAGDLIMRSARRCKAEIIPVDSEQSAIFQCLEGRNRRDLSRVYLTASGGALKDVPRSRFNRLTVREILKHPRWKMGKKITVDSATLMNKGFEVIEAKHLFGLSIRQIDVLVHPEAIIHSMVSFKDGSIIAQLGATDMRLPIQYALTYPDRLPSGLRDTDFVREGKFHFARPDMKKFPSLALAIEVGEKGGTLPCVLNAADEEAVRAFLEQKIRFTRIYDIVARVVRKHRSVRHPQLKDIWESDGWARREALKNIAAS